MSVEIEEGVFSFQTMLLDQIHDLITVTDLDGGITYINAAACRSLGRERRELIGKRVSTFGEDPSRGARQQEIIRRTLSEGRWRGEVVNVTGDGAPIVLDCRTYLLYDDAGVPTGMVGISTDITRRKRREQELERLAEAVRQAGDGIVITAPDGTIQYANPAFEQMTGYDADALLGKTPRILKSGRQDAPFYQNLWNTILAGDRWTGQLVNRRRDGSLYTADCSITPMKDGGGRIVQFVWVTRDISDAVELERRVAASQQMEAIGTLAGGIAHDFNNLLFPILGLSELMAEDPALDGPNRQNLLEILKAARRGRELVKQILSFSRQAEPEKMIIQLQPILREVVKLSRSAIPSDIAIDEEFSKDCGPVLAVPGQIHQVAMNLMTNAYHAVEKTSGRITVTLKAETLDARQAETLMMNPGVYAVIGVADTGDGIDPALLEKIFEPYFTTKEKHKGTGLGLSMVRSIVKDHGGGIHVASDKGGGTCFRVYLPLQAKTAGACEHRPAAVSATGDERVLLVDDDAPIVRIESIMLERLGYRVTGYTSSAEALSAFEAAPHAFDLVITDMAMPNMPGDRFAQAVKALRRDIPVIICTGFSEKIDDASAAALDVEGVLMKPLAISDLAQTVRRVLGRNHGQDS